MQKYVIDCGGWRGDSVETLRRQFLPDHIYTFEANPNFKKFYHFKNHTLINKAVWIYDGEIDFYLGGDYDMGSSVIQKDNTGKSIKVPCIDFSKWIIDNFKKEDEIILKMDIEGAEYKVLGKMIDDGSTDYINQFLVEIHHNKYPEIATKEEIDKILKLKIEIWD